MTPDEKLRSYYEKAAAEIIERISSATNLASLRKQKALLKEIASILDELNSNAVDWVEQYVTDAYIEGSGFALTEMQTVGLNPATTLLQPVIHQEAVRALVDDAFGDLLNATSHMDRSLKRTIRSIANEQLRTAVITGQASKKTGKEVTEDLIAKGISAITKSDGAQLRAEDYAQLVARTKVREAHTNGSINRYVENGQDLVSIPAHHPTCGVCAPKQGKVYSISGKDERFPALATIKGGPPFHPNCTHTLKPFVERLKEADEIRSAMKESNTSVFLDNRTKKQISAYEELQDKNRQRTQIRNQFYRYQARLGDKAPNSLAEFVRVKRKGGERWTELQNLYRQSSN
jgi:hypothetical protein